MIAGCTATDTEFVEQMQKNYDLFAPDLERYYVQDPTLSPDRRQIRVGALKSWSDVIKAAREATQ